MRYSDQKEGVYAMVSSIPRVLRAKPEVRGYWAGGYGVPLVSR